MFSRRTCILYNIPTGFTRGRANRRGHLLQYFELAHTRVDCVLISLANNTNEYLYVLCLSYTTKT